MRELGGVAGIFISHNGVIWRECGPLHERSAANRENSFDAYP